MEDLLFWSISDCSNKTQNLFAPDDGKIYSTKLNIRQVEQATGKKLMVCPC